MRLSAAKDDIAKGPKKTNPTKKQKYTLCALKENNRINQILNLCLN